ncbi:MAG TPA: sugar transferase [Anaerolineae bacterium]
MHSSTTRTRISNTVATSRPLETSPVGYQREWKLYVLVLLVLDGLVIWGSLTLAYSVRMTSGLLIYNAPYDPAIYRELALLNVPIWLILFALLGLYQRDNHLGGTIEYQQILKACTIGVIAIIVVSFLWHDLTLVSRGWLLLSWGMACGLLGLERFVIRRVAYQLRQHGWFTARVLIVGANEQGLAMARQWNQSATSGMQVIGFIDDFKPLGTTVWGDLKVIGRPSALATVAGSTRADEVVVVPNAIAWESFEEIIARAGTPQRYSLRLSPGFYELFATGVAITNKTFVPLFKINEARIVGVDALLKALLDYGLGTLLLALAALFMLLISLGLRASTPRRPILVRHSTLGRGGTTFQMLKFNTVAGPDRLSGLAEILFRSGLDKLPQLINVLTGQMSLVGPRPRVIGGEEADARTARNLQAVKPGLLGPWLVPQYWSSSDEGRDELYYMRNWTVWLDIQILFQAVLSAISVGRRASAQDADTTAAHTGEPSVIQVPTLEPHCLPESSDSSSR